MIQWLHDLFQPFVYVGTVEARTTLLNEDGSAAPGGEMRGYFILTEKAGGRWRNVREVGAPGHSALANRTRAQVEAWRVGGPMPEKLTPAPIPAPKKKPQAELLVFPGGKSS